MSELSIEQIAGVAAAVVTVIVIVLGAARRAASGHAPEPPGSPQNPYLLLDAKQVQALIDAIGLQVVAMAEARRALDRNTEQAREVQEEAERLSRDMRELGDRIARSGR